MLSKSIEVATPREPTAASDFAGCLLCDFSLAVSVFHSVAESLVLIFPAIYEMSGGLLVQWLLKYNVS